MSFLIDPFHLQRCVEDSIAHRHKKGIFHALNQRLVQQYAPFFLGGIELNKHCILYYTSMNEFLLLFRNSKKYNFLTSYSPYCSTYDVVLKGCIRAQHLEQVPPGTICFSHRNRDKQRQQNHKEIVTLDHGDMMIRETGTQSRVGIDDDTWILEYIRGSVPVWYGSSLYRSFFQHLYTYNVWASVYQTWITNWTWCRDWVYSNGFWRRNGSFITGEIANAETMQNV